MTYELSSTSWGEEEIAALQRVIRSGRFTMGERIVFLPYTEEMYATTQAWIHERGIFDGQPPVADYRGSVAA